jgi:hypothetical protein
MAHYQPSSGISRQASAIRLLAESTGTNGEARGFEGTSSSQFSSNLLISRVPSVGSTSRRTASAQDVAAQLQRSAAKRRTSGVRREQSHPLRHDFLRKLNDLPVASFGPVTNPVPNSLEEFASGSSPAAASTLVGPSGVRGRAGAVARAALAVPG